MAAFFFVQHTEQIAWPFFFCFICTSLVFVRYLFEVNMCDIWAWHSVNRQAIIGTGLSAVCLMPAYCESLPETGAVNIPIDPEAGGPTMM